MKLIKVYFKIIFLILYCAFHLNAQPNIFSKIYFDDVISTSAVKTTDNCYLISGESNGKGLVLKVDSLGGYLWSKEYVVPTSVNERFNDIIATNDSCYLLIGKALNTVSNNLDILCIKINTNGDTLWSKAIAGNGSEEPYSVEQTFDKGYIITGIGGNSQPNEIFVAKTDSSGNLQWMDNFVGGNNNNYAYEVKQTPDSGYVIIGFMENFPPLDIKIFLLKLSGNGSQLWTKRYSKSIPDYCNGWDFEITNDGFLCVVNIGYNLGLMKTDFSGNLMWVKEYSSTANNCLNCIGTKIQRTTDNNFVVVNGTGFGACELFKVDSGGNMIWYQDLNLIPSEVIEDKDTGLFIVGNGPMFGLRLSGPSSPHIGIVKTDSLGNGSSCTFLYPNIPAFQSSLVIDSTLFTMTTGGSNVSLLFGINNIPLQTDSGCISAAGSITDDISNIGFTVFPNPSVGEINFKFDNNISDCSISIVNLLGQEVFFKAIEENNINRVTVSEKLPAGVYTIIVKNKSSIQTRKLVVE